MLPTSSVSDVGFHRADALVHCMGIAPTYHHGHDHPLAAMTLDPHPSTWRPTLDPWPLWRQVSTVPFP